MRVPVIDSPQVAPQPLPDVRVNLQNVGAGAEAIGQGLKQIGGGADQLGGDIEEYQRRTARQANHIAVGNGLTQLLKDRNAIGYGDLTQTPPQSAPGVTGPRPLQAPGGAASSQAAGDTAFADDVDTHEPATAPSQAAADALASPSSGVPEQGYFNTRGMDAAKHAHASVDTFAGRVDAIADGMPNDEARAMFLEEGGRQVEEFRGQVERHAYQQQQVAKESAAQGLMAASFGAIQKAADFFSPGEGDGAIEAAKVQMAPVEKMVRGLAATPEEGEAQVMTYRQQVADNLTKRYVDAKDWASAQKVLDGMQDALRYGKDGEGKYAAWEKTVAAGQQQGDGDAAAVALVNGAREPGGLINTTKIDDAVLAMPNDKRTPQFLEALQKYRSIAEDANRGRAANAFKAALSQYQQGGNSLSSIDASTTTWLQDNDPEGWRQLQKDAREDAAARRSGKKEGATPDQDSTYANFAMAMVDNPEQFKDISPDQLAHDVLGRVTQQQLNRLQDQLREVHGQKPVSEQSLPGYAHNLILQGLRDAFPNEKHPETSDNTAGRSYTQTEAALMGFRQNYRAANSGAEPPLDAMRAQVAEQLAKVTVQQPWYRPNTTVPLAEYQANPELRGKPLVPADDVPKDWVEAIRARAPNATPAQMQAVYRSMLRRAQGTNGTPPVQASRPPPPPAPRSDAPDFKPAPTGAKLRAPERPSLVHPTNAAILSAGAVSDADRQANFDRQVDDIKP